MKHALRVLFQDQQFFMLCLGKHKLTLEGFKLVIDVVCVCFEKNIFSNL